VYLSGQTLKSKTIAAMVSQSLPEPGDEMQSLARARQSPARIHYSMCVLSSWGNLGSEFFLNVPLLQAGVEAVLEAGDSTEMLSLTSVT